MRELICPWKSAAWTLIFWHLISGGEWGADRHGKQCGTFPSRVGGEGNCTEAAGGVCKGAERQRWEVTGKDDSRGGNGWPGRWRASSCGGSFKDVGSVFLPQDCSTLWNISPLLCKAAWDTFQLTIVIVTCHQRAKGQECRRMVVIVCSCCGEESFLRKSHLWGREMGEIPNHFQQSSLPRYFQNYLSQYCPTSAWIKCIFIIEAKDVDFGRSVTKLQTVMCNPYHWVAINVLCRFWFVYAHILSRGVVIIMYTFVHVVLSSFVHMHFWWCCQCLVNIIFHRCLIKIFLFPVSWISKMKL